MKGKYVCTLREKIVNNISTLRYANFCGTNYKESTKIFMGRREQHFGLGIFTSQLMSRSNCQHAILTREAYKRRKVGGPIFEKCTSSYSDFLFFSRNALHFHLSILILQPWRLHVNFSPGQKPQQFDWELILEETISNNTLHPKTTTLSHKISSHRFIATKLVTTIYAEFLSLHQINYDLVSSSYIQYSIKNRL